MSLECKADMINDKTISLLSRPLKLWEAVIGSCTGRARKNEDDSHIIRGTPQNAQRRHA